MGFAVSGDFRSRAAMVKWEVKASRHSGTAAPAADQAGGHDVSGASPLIILGVILLIIGFIAKIAIIWTIGIIVVVIGAILALLGMAGHAVGGRRHYF
jgi:Family of unknown function (DUF6131)